MSFNDDCSGMFLVKDDEQSCTGHFTYEMTDYANVFLNFKDAQCDIKKGLYKCSYSLIHLTESNIEVMDISCSWNNKMEQLTRYEK